MVLVVLVGGFVVVVVVVEILILFARPKREKKEISTIRFRNSSKMAKNAIKSELYGSQFCEVKTL